MRHVLPFIVMVTLVGLAPCLAADDTLSQLRRESAQLRQELKAVSERQAALEKELEALQARMEAYCQENQAERETQPNQDKNDAAKDARKVDNGDRSRRAATAPSEQPRQEKAASSQSDTPAAAPQQPSKKEGRLDFALLPDAEVILFHDKAFLQAGFSRVLRGTMTAQLKNEISSEESGIISRYSEAFTHFNFLCSANVTKSIDKDGSKISYEQIDWMMGWEADAPAAIWDKDPQMAATTALELTQLVHQSLMAELLNSELRKKLQFWEFKSSAARDTMPGWTLYLVRCYPTVTTKYEVLWAVADNRKLFFLGPAETVLRQLNAGGEGAAALRVVYKQMRASADGQPRLAMTTLVKEDAVKKIDNFLLDFRRPGDMALMQYLNRTTSCQLLLTAKESEMQAHMEIAFRDSVVSKDFHNLLKQMTVPVVLGLFVKANLDSLTSVKEVEVDNKNGSTVTIDTRMPLMEFLRLLASQEVIKFSTAQ